MGKRCRLENIRCDGLTRHICPTRGSAVIYWKSKHEHYYAAICSLKAALIIQPSQSRIYSGRAKNSAMRWTTIRIRKMAERFSRGSLHLNQEHSHACTAAHGKGTARRCCGLWVIDYLG